MIYPVMAEEERNFAYGRAARPSSHPPSSLTFSVSLPVLATGACRYLDFIRSVDFYKPDMQYIWGTNPALAGPAATPTPIPAAAAAPAAEAPASVQKE